MQMPSSWARTDAIATTRSHAVRHERHARAAVVLWPMLIQASAPRVASDLDTKGALWCGAKDAAWQGRWFAWMADGTTRGMDAKSEWVHLLRAGTVCNPRRPRVASICVELSQLHSTLSRGLPRTVRYMEGMCGAAPDCG